MKILICGAGVIGTIYGARLQRSGHRVTMLARGQRLGEIRRDGLIIEDITSGSRFSTPVETIERLDPNGAYDLAVVTVRLEQLAGVAAAFPEILKPLP